MPANSLNAICMYCGSNIGRRSSYAAAARGLADALIERDIALVYGGASVGMMGALADTVLASGGRAIGVIPESLARKELAHADLSELHVTSSMHERKALMAELADGFIALPGGIGTLEELFEIWTWAQLGLHTKPCGLLNVDGYFDSLLDFLDHTVAAQFVRPDHRSLLFAETTPGALLDGFVTYEAPSVPKWISHESS